MGDTKPIIRQAGEGQRLWFAGGGIFTMKVFASDTGGEFFLLEDELAQGKTTPMHLHPNEDESIYVLEGEILVHYDGENHRVGERGFFFAPRGVPHAFMVTSETARILAWQTPGSGEQFYLDVTDPAGDDTDPARTDWARLLEAAKSSPSIEILGPSPFTGIETTAGATA